MLPYYFSHFDTRISHRKPYFETFYIDNLYMVKSGKQTFPAPKGDYVTTIQILNSTRIRLKAASRKDQTYDDKIRELLDLEPRSK